MIRKISILLLLLIITVLPFSSCSAGVDGDDRFTVVTTVFPVYDWVQNIVADTGAEVIMLADKGVDLHSYQPTVDDMVTISGCDMFIYIGGESDSWAEDIADSVLNGNTVSLALLNELGSAAKAEETKEGMEDEEDGHDGEDSKDEHIWLSLKNAVKLCNIITEKLCELNENSKEAYLSNAAAYTEKLEKLDGEYEKAVESSAQDTLIFADRFPFLYLTSDYGIDYYAAFAGCSAETEASFNTIMFLAGKTDELGLKYIMKTEGSDGRIAETVRSSTSSKDQKILTLDSMQSVSDEDVGNGITYLKIMEENLLTLTEALSQGE